MKDDLDDIELDIDIDDKPKANSGLVEDKAVVGENNSSEQVFDSERLVEKGEKAFIHEDIKSDSPAIILENASKKSSRKLFAIVTMLLLVLGIAFWAFKDPIIGMFVKSPENVSQNTDNNSVAITDPELKRFIEPTTGEKWLPSPKDMQPQGWLKVEHLSNFKDIGVGTRYYQSAQDQMNEYKPTYKKIGSRSGHTIVLVFSPSEGMGGMYYIFEKRSDGTAALIVRPQESGNVHDDYVDFMKKSIDEKSATIDETIHYDSLNIPSKISIDKDGEVLRPDNMWIADGMVGSVSDAEGVKKSLVKKLGGSSLYRVETKYTDTQLTNIGYYIELPIGANVGVKYIPNQLSLEGYSLDDGISMQYKNNDGAMVYDQIMPIARGCGGNLAAITKSDSLSDSDLIQIGKTNTGAPLYEPKDKDIELYKKAYDEYRLMNGNEAVSREEYLKQHGLMVLKGKRGELLVYVREKYAAVGGCAKPVVYLYPTQTTVVNVRVGADVTVSDPLYPGDGWRGVLAQSDGRLTYQNKKYDSLFWEGQGIGRYPGIVSGTVVKRVDVEATIRRQLSEQGLNTKESADFMEFWTDKIPNKPYVRLTWLNTRQMDNLAPLYISPKPDTVIRVFLDMDGFDSPPKLAPQKLSAIPRKGFTVVEWGGLTTEFRR